MFYPSNFYDIIGVQYDKPVNYWKLNNPMMWLIHFEFFLLEFLISLNLLLLGLFFALVITPWTIFLFTFGPFSFLEIWLYLLIFFFHYVF